VLIVCELSNIPVAWGDVLVVPALAVSERYDSNVFLTPKINGVQREDIVTSVTPSISALHRGDYAQTTVQLSGVGERYVNNPGLSYIGGGGGIASNLNRLVQRYNPRLTLTVTDSAFYTPQAPAFASATFGEDTSVFGRGLQIVRVNTFSNTAAVNGTYAITPTTVVQLGYTNSIIRFGRTAIDTGGTGLIDTDSHGVTSSIRQQVSVRDALGFTYAYQRIVFKGDQSGALSDGYQSHGGSLSWSRTWIPELRSTTFAGAMLIVQGSNTLSTTSGASSQAPGNLVIYQGGAALMWTDLVQVAPGMAGATSMPGIAVGGFGSTGGMGGQTGLSAFGTGARTLGILNYTAGVYPSYFSVGTPLLSHVVSGTFTRRIGSSWALSTVGDYARDETLPGSSNASQRDVSITSYGGSLSLSYLISPGLVASLSGDYHKFDGQGLALGGALSGAALNFDRKVAMISLTKVWLP